MARAPFISWTLFAARDVMRTCALDSCTDSTVARRARVRPIVMGRTGSDASIDELLEPDDHDPIFDDVSLSDAERVALERELSYWKRAFRNTSGPLRTRGRRTSRSDPTVCSTDSTTRVRH